MPSFIRKLSPRASISRDIISKIGTAMHVIDLMQLPAPKISASTSYHFSKLALGTLMFSR